jgi:hypothetical protein
MIFDQAGRQMALDKTGDIDTVYIGNSKFIPVGKVFYEVATGTPVALFIQYKTSILPPGNNTGFGTSQTSAISNITDLKAAGTAYSLKLPDDYQLTSKTIYWLKRDDRYTSVKNIKDILNFFPNKSEPIRQYVKVNNPGFRNHDDIKKLVEFCNQ